MAALIRNQTTDTIWGNRAGAIAAYEKKGPDLVLLDLGLPPSPNLTIEGLATLEEILIIKPKARVIIISGQGERENALEAIGRGAYDFMSKPVDTDQLQLVLRRCHNVVSLERDFLSRQLDSVSTQADFEGMLGQSDPMLKVFNLVKKVGPSDAPIMILGESGTGKEMVAAAIHNQSNRKDEPFVPINCSAIPE